MCILLCRHVAEYKMTSEPDLPHKHLFLISTSRGPQGPHLLLVFNPEVSRVIKAIQLSFPALTICPLHPSPGIGEETDWPLSEVSCGLLAVGGGCGLVVLLDLRLDDEEEVFGESSPSEVGTYLLSCSSNSLSLFHTSNLSCYLVCSLIEYNVQQRPDNRQGRAAPGETGVHRGPVSPLVHSPWHETTHRDKLCIQV